MHIVKSISGIEVRLTDERWLHIVEGHPEMAGFLHDVLLTVAVPDIIFQGSTNELLAAVYKRKDKMLVVVYRETEADGFIITAILLNILKRY